VSVARELVDATEYVRERLRGVVEPQGNEAALLVQRVAKPERAGLQLRQSEPNAWADMQSTSTREFSRPASIFAGMLSPGRISHSRL